LAPAIAIATSSGGAAWGAALGATAGLAAAAGAAAAGAAAAGAAAAGAAGAAGALAGASAEPQATKNRRVNTKGTDTIAFVFLNQLLVIINPPKGQVLYQAMPFFLDSRFCLPPTTLATDQNHKHRAKTGLAQEGPKSPVSPPVSEIKFENVLAYLPFGYPTVFSHYRDLLTLVNVA